MECSKENVWTIWTDIAGLRMENHGNMLKEWIFPEAILTR